MSDLASADIISVAPEYMILDPVIKYHNAKLKNMFRVELEAKATDKNCF